ncbi:hypothetical protein GX48_05356 [Paracoccidioides brasiliensis]|nr:hypothetical protein GX48_05356 [Paracoccidioides brasiliensis]
MNSVSSSNPGLGIRGYERLGKATKVKPTGSLAPNVIRWPRDTQRRDRDGERKSRRYPKAKPFQNLQCVHIYPDIRGQRKDNGVRARRGDGGEADKEAKIRSYASSVHTTEETPKQHEAGRYVGEWGGGV